MLEPNPYSPSEQERGEVVGNEHRPRRRIAALSIALMTLVLLCGFVTLVGFESLELVFASAVWIVVCLPMAALVDRWGIVGFFVAIPVCMILTPVAFLMTLGIAITLGIDVMPLPN